MSVRDNVRFDLEKHRELWGEFEFDEQQYDETFAAGVGRMPARCEPSATICATTSSTRHRMPAKAACSSAASHESEGNPATVPTCPPPTDIVLTLGRGRRGSAALDGGLRIGRLSLS